MHIKKYIIIVLALLSSFCTNSDNKDSKNAPLNSTEKTIKKTVQTGSSRFITIDLQETNIPGYWLYLPSNYDTHDTFPVLVFLHGGGYKIHTDIEKFRDNGPMGFLLYSIKLSNEVKELIAKFIIVNPVLPEDPDNFTLWVDNIDTLDKIIDSVISSYYKGDYTRIYITGNSRGGQGVWRFPKYSRHRVAAIAPICGHYIDSSNLQALIDVPIWTFCNTGDRLYRVQMRAVSFIESIGGDPFLKIDNSTPDDPSYLLQKHIVTSYQKIGHDAWRMTYKNPHIYRWMLNFKNSK